MVAYQKAVDLSGHDLDMPWLQFSRAIEEAKRRWDRAHRRGYANRVPGMDNGWENDFQSHLMGAATEAAYALYLGVSWEPDLNAFHRTPDVAGHEVRGIRPAHGNLRLTTADPFDRWYVFVLYMAPKFRILGRIYWTEERAEHAKRKGAEVKGKYWWGDYGNYGKPCYMLPFHLLQSMA